MAQYPSLVAEKGYRFFSITSYSAFRLQRQCCSLTLIFAHNLALCSNHRKSPGPARYQDMNHANRYYITTARLTQPFRGSRGSPLVGSLPAEFGRNALSVADAGWKEYGDLFALHWGRARCMSSRTPTWPRPCD